MRRDELVDQHNRNSAAESFGKSRHGFAAGHRRLRGEIVAVAWERGPARSPFAKAAEGVRTGRTLVKADGPPTGSCVLRRLPEFGVGRERRD